MSTTPTRTVRLVLHSRQLDEDGKDAAENTTYDNSTSGLAATDVQAAIDEVAAAGGGGGEPTADAHIADTSDAHDASAISIADAGGYFTGTDVEAALQEIGAGGIGGGSVTAAQIAALGFVGPILMADGIANPPEPLYTDDGTDYLYADL